MEDLAKRFCDQLYDGQVPLRPAPGAAKMPPGRCPVTTAVRRAAARCEGQFFHVEMGSWHGDSALAAAAAHDRCVVIAVDTWSGSAVIWLNTQAGHAWNRSRLFLDKGMPRIYEAFMANVQRYAQADRIVPLRMPTRTAGEILLNGAFSWMPVRSVFVDAAHDRESVAEDLRIAKALLARSGGGTLCGHDWPWSTVKDGFADAFPGVEPEDAGAHFLLEI
jgi:hypothetical protein